MGSILGLGRSPREGHGSPLQCSCLENPMDRVPFLWEKQDAASSEIFLMTGLPCLPAAKLL